MSFRSSILALAATVFLCSPAIAAEEIWAVTVNNNLVNFISSAPWSFSSRPISGMQAGESALGLDFRPALPVGRLYVLGSTGRIYLINNPVSGSATAVGGGPFAVLNGTRFGMDFNPVVDRIRVISNTGQNLRLHPDLGTLVFTDGAIAYAGTDGNAGADADATAGAYTNNNAGAGSTTLYDIDTNLDVLVTQVPPNSGTLNTVGPLGVNASGVNGFDISGMGGTAYAALDVGGANSTLFVINLASGQAGSLGVIGCAELITGLSVSPFAPTPAKKSTWGAIKSLYR